MWAGFDTIIYFIKTHKFKLFAKTEEEIKLKKLAIKLQLNKIILDFILVLILGIIFNLLKKKLNIDLNVIIPLEIKNFLPINLEENQNAIYYIVYLLISSLQNLYSVKKENQEELKKMI